MEDPAQAGQARQTNPSVTRSDKIWMDDGNIVIIAEKTAFRVHKGVLSLHSEVFKNMFELGQPSDSSYDEIFEGCPTVHISDSASDFTVILQILYSAGKSMKLDESGDLKLLAMVSLGRKYQIPHVEEPALQTLKSDYPVTLEDWETTHPNRPETFKNAKERSTSCIQSIRCYRTAQTLDLKFMLPIHSRLIFLLTPQELIFGFESVWGDREEFTQSEQVALLEFKEELCRTNSVLIANLYDSLQKRKDNCFIATCDSGTAWLQTVLKTFNNFLGSPLRIWQFICHDIATDNQIACESCHEQVRNSCQVIRLDLWQEMGKYWEVPGWGTTTEGGKAS